MSEIISIALSDWAQPCSSELQQRAIDALEHGHVVLIPDLRFELEAGERKLLTPAVAGHSKNISLNPSTGIVRGCGGDEAEASALRAMMMRFAADSTALLRRLSPWYETGLQQGRTSFRPAEIAGRPTSWRKDDTRLHVDSFPSSPTRGKRILRLFSNINPDGQTRKWRLGTSFEDIAARYARSLPAPVPGTAYLRNLLGLTKSLRSPYDHFMLQLHDRMKADAAYQAEFGQSLHEFASGSTWIVFTDQVSHAATAGQYALEQTFYLPVESMKNPSLAPLRVLERLLGRQLA